MPYLVIMTVSTRIFLILDQFQVCFTFSANHELCLGADLPSDYKHLPPLAALCSLSSILNLKLLVVSLGSVEADLGLKLYRVLEGSLIRESHRDTDERVNW